MDKKVTNIIFAGLGGQGVLKVTDILAEALFKASYDVKKSEVHGMSQRGGSVSSEVRFGEKVNSPMVPDKECDYLVILEPTQTKVNIGRIRPGAVVIEPDAIETSKLGSPKTANIALLGVLSTYLGLDEKVWTEAIKESLAPKLHQMNLEAFAMGRSSC